MDNTASNFLRPITIKILAVMIVYYMSNYLDLFIDFRNGNKSAV